jgi:hypothetical protein
VKQFTDVLLQGRLLDLPTNIIRVTKRLPGTNTLAYYGNLLTTAVKSFIALGKSLGKAIMCKSKQFCGCCNIKLKLFMGLSEITNVRKMKPRKGVKCFGNNQAFLYLKSYTKVQPYKLTT